MDPPKTDYRSKTPETWLRRPDSVNGLTSQQIHSARFKLARQQPVRQSASASFEKVKPVSFTSSAITDLRTCADLASPDIVHGGFQVRKE